MWTQLALTRKEALFGYLMVRKAYKNPLRVAHIEKFGIQFLDNRLYKETPKPKPVKKSNARNKKKKRTAAAPPPAVRYSRRSTRSSTVQEEPVPIEEVEEEESEDEGEWVPWKLVIQNQNLCKFTSIDLFA